MEPDPRHADFLKETCGLNTGSRSVSTPRDKMSEKTKLMNRGTARYHSPSLRHNEIGMHRG